MDSSIWPDLVVAIPDGEISAAQFDDPLVVEKEIVHAGDFAKYDLSGKVTARYNITEDHLNHWHKTFAEMAKDSVEVPMPLEHTRSPEARRATLIGTERRKNNKGVESLFGKVKFKDVKAKEALSTSQVSVFVPKQSGKFKMPIEHVAFTDYPVISTLEPFNIVASYFGEAMNEDDDMTLRDLATQAGVDPAITDEQQLLMALSQKLAAIPKAPVPPAPAPAPVGPPRPPMRFSKDQLPVVDPLVLQMVKENRQLKLSRLSEGNNARITPAQRKILEDRFCSDDAISLSHAVGNSEDFDAAIRMIEAGSPIRGEQKTGPQAMALSKDETPTSNRLVANAEQRAKDAKEQYIS